MKLFRQEHFGGQAGREHELRRRLLDRLDRDPRLQRKDAKVAEDAKRFLIFVRCGSEENRQATAAAGWQALAIRVWIRFKARFALKFRRAPEPHKISNLPAPSLRSAFDKLSASGCHTPGCNHKGHDHPFFFHARCHPHSPTWASYLDGAITIECAECRRVIARVKVAAE